MLDMLAVCPKIFHKYLSPIVIGSLVILFIGCVEPFRPPLEVRDTGRLLVVEGLITDETGPFRVSLTSSIPVYENTVVSYYPPVSGAEVQIVDDKGNVYLLFEKEAGWYETEDKHIQGIPGNIYVLMITTPDGWQYESSPVLMRETPEIDRVYYKEIKRMQFDLETPYEENWLNILVDTRAEEAGIDYFKWDFEETWEFEMPTYVEVSHGPEGPPPSMESIDVEWERKHCWASAPSSSILVTSTANALDNEIEGFILQSIGPPDDRLNIRYSILVKQYVIDRNLYNFFKRIRESNEETGGIYEKPPAEIFGNIQCCNGVTEALGYFMASAVKTKRIFINPAEHGVAKGTAYGNCGWTDSPPVYHSGLLYGTYKGGTTNVWSDNRYCTDCRLRGTNFKPDFWE
jgi:hypothetical protein